MERARHRYDALAPFALRWDVPAGAPQAGAVGAGQCGRGLQPGLVSRVRWGGSRRPGTGLEQAGCHERAIAIGASNPDIPHQGALRVAIGGLSLQPDVLSLDQGRVGRGCFAGEAGITGRRLKPQILHRLLLATEVDGDTRAVEDGGDRGLEQVGRGGWLGFAQRQRGPEIDRSLAYEERQIVTAPRWQQKEQQRLGGFARFDRDSILVTPGRIESSQRGDDIGTGVEIDDRAGAAIEEAEIAHGLGRSAVTLICHPGNQEYPVAGTRRERVFGKAFSAQCGEQREAERACDELLRWWFAGVDGSRLGQRRLPWGGHGLALSTGSRSR